MGQSDLFSFVSASKKFHPCKTARKKKPSRALFFFFFSLLYVIITFWQARRGHQPVHHEKNSAYRRSRAYGKPARLHHRAHLQRCNGHGSVSGKHQASALPKPRGAARQRRFQRRESGNLPDVRAARPPRYHHRQGKHRRFRHTQRRHRARTRQISAICGFRRSARPERHAPAGGGRGGNAGRSGHLQLLLRHAGWKNPPAFTTA